MALGQFKFKYHFVAPGEPGYKEYVGTCTEIRPDVWRITAGRSTITVEGNEDDDLLQAWYEEYYSRYHVDVGVIWMGKTKYVKYRKNAVRKKTRRSSTNGFGLAKM